MRRALFGNVYSLSLFFEDNYGQGQEDGEGDDGEVSSEVFYLGFKGEFMRLNREAVEVGYEVAANPKDHVLAQGIGMGVGEGMIGRGG